MHTLKELLKRILPAPWLPAYHLFLSWFADLLYRHPSRKMLVIGVTGTTGKSSTIYILRHILEQAGKKVGCISTMEFCDGNNCELNDKKMTMLGRMQSQRMLGAMVANGCDVAIIETTSQGIVQFRHRHIAYDIVALTNLYEEHLEAHGGFENYKKAKEELFAHLQRGKSQKQSQKQPTTYPDEKSGPRPKRRGNPQPTASVVHTDSEHAGDFFAYDADEKWTFGHAPRTGHHVLCNTVHQNKNGTVFTLNGEQMQTPLLGEHVIENICCAAAIAAAAHIPTMYVAAAVSRLRSLPGRIEHIEEGQPFSVIVDYAFEPRAMEALYRVVAFIAPQRVIHVFGATGGGRDTAKRAVLGRYIGERAAVCMVTNEDPYDDDPQVIIDEVAAGAVAAGKKDGENLFRIQDRRAAIAKAIAFAQPGDLVLITGKGTEQRMAVAGGKLIPWDDRVVVREELAKGRFV